MMKRRKTDPWEAPSIPDESIINENTLGPFTAITWAMYDQLSESVPLEQVRPKELKEIKCKNCGAPLKPGQKFCEYCGTSHEWR